MNYKKVIGRVLEEIKKEKPDLSYIRGMLEVLVDDSVETTYKLGTIAAQGSIFPKSLVNTTEIKSDEKTTAGIERIGPIAPLA